MTSRTLLRGLALAATFAPTPGNAEPRAKTEGVTVGTFGQEVAVCYSGNDGLPDLRVFDIARSRTGDVYAVTSGGVARFLDGKWTTIRGLPKGPIRVIATGGRLAYTVVGVSLYRISGTAATKFGENLPEPPTCLAADPAGLWIGTDRGLLRVVSNRPARDNDLQGLLQDGAAIRQVAVDAEGRVAVAAKAGLFIRKGDAWSQLYPRDKHYSWAVYDARGVAFDGQGRLWFCSPQGVGCLSGDRWALYTGGEGLAYNDFTTTAAGADGTVWFGTIQGAIRFDGKRWAYRQGRRWLPDDRISAVAVDETGNAWFATSAGVGLIERRPMTLAEKAELFEDRIDKRHRRTPYGYVNECGLKSPGELTAWENYDSDNDGLWTGMYGAGECFAYAATKDPLAKKRAKAAFEALKFLCDVTQGGEKTVQRGFPTRSILPTDGRNPNEGHSPESDRQGQVNDRLWKVLHPRWPKSADGKWYWKCDTSSDELDGHYFLNSLYYDLVADSEDEKARVRKVICDTTDHLMENGFALVDWDGKPTRWAYFGPQELNHNPDRWQERGMNSLGILSYLATAEHVSGNAKYARAKRELIDKHGYAINVYQSAKIHDGAGTGNQSDNEMTIMRFFTYLRYEKDPQVRSMIEWAFWRYWWHVRRERNPFFNFLYAASYDPKSKSFWNETYEPVGNWLNESVQALIGQPMDLVNWPLRNSHRLDILPHPEYPRNPDGTPIFGYMRDGGVVPIENRYIQHWSEDMWRLDQGGNGTTESDGAYWLMAYYAGKYFGFIKD